MKFALVVLFAFAAYLSFIGADVDSDWIEFKEKFNKSYDEEEDKVRKEIFVKHLENVAEHNKKYEAGEVTFSIGVNQFSDLKPEERKHLHGLVLPSSKSKK